MQFLRDKTCIWLLLIGNFGKNPTDDIMKISQNSRPEVGRESVCNPARQRTHRGQNNAKIQRHFWFLPPRTLQEFEKKVCDSFVGKCYKSIACWEALRMSVSIISWSYAKYVWSIHFSDCLNFGLEIENFRKFKTLLNKRFNGKCTRAPSLTALWAEEGTYIVQRNPVRLGAGG